MDSKHIYNLIVKNHLYTNTRTYVQLFTDGSQLFWNKELSFTQYINDINNRLNDFYKGIRQNNIIQNSIYCEHQKFTTNINQIMKSNFYKRMDRTYIFSRNYKQLIKATNDQQTFYYCQLQKVTQQIFNELLKIKGKFLIVCNNFDNYIKHGLNEICIDNIIFVYNYEIQHNQELF